MYYKKTILLALLISCPCSTWSLPASDPQVNQEIDNIEDLLAVESEFIENTVDPQLVAIVAAPPGFPGERLVAIKPPPPGFPGDRLTGTSNTNPQENSNGAYSFRYETEDGTVREEQGAPLENGGMGTSGSYEYVGPDGRIYRVDFVADENGFQPRGDHLPQPPALPPALQRFEDARNGKLSRNKSSSGSGSSAVLDVRSSRGEFDQKSIRFGSGRPLPKTGRNIRFRPQQ